jgi:vacuolar-type H+-ATPase subunit C/Vma6
MQPLAGSFEFIQAKVHALRSRVYEHERLDDLCDLRTIAQLWHRLYPEADPGDHRTLQRRLLADHIHTLETVRRHLPSELTDFYAWMMRRYQVENLKVLLRAWKAHEPIEQVLPFLAPLMPDMALDPRPFLRTSSLGDFLMLIPVAELRVAGERAGARYADTGETFFIETAFDTAYYAHLLDRHEGLPARHREGTHALILNEVSIFDILSIFRLKLNYGMRYEQAAVFLVPAIGGPMELERLYDYPDFGDMVERIPEELLPHAPRPEIETIADLELALWERGLQRANAQFYHSVEDLGAAVAFATIKRMELANLFRVIEGMRYGLSPEAIRQGFIRPRPLALVH